MYTSLAFESSIYYCTIMYMPLQTYDKMLIFITHLWSWWSACEQSKVCDLQHQDFQTMGSKWGQFLGELCDTCTCTAYYMTCILWRGFAVSLQVQDVLVKQFMWCLSLLKLNRVHLTSFLVFLVRTYYMYFCDFFYFYYFCILIPF